MKDIKTRHTIPWGQYVVHMLYTGQLQVALRPNSLSVPQDTGIKMWTTQKRLSCHHRRTAVNLLRSSESSPPSSMKTKCVWCVRLAGELLASFVMVEMVAFRVLGSKCRHTEYQTSHISWINPMGNNVNAYKWTKAGFEEDIWERVWAD